MNRSSRRLRRLLAAAFFLIFIVAAPAIVVSTAGYRYNFVKGRLERTGVLFISSRPSAATVEVNGEIRKERTPARVKGLLPGSYHVRLSRDGYHPWTRTVEVRSRETTFLNNVILFRRGLPEQVAELGILQAEFSPDRRYAAVIAEEDSFLELRVLDLRTGGSHLPYRTGAGPEVELRLEWSPSSDRLLIVRTDGREVSAAAWRASAPLDAADLSSFGPRRLSEATWSEEGRFIYVSAEGRLFRVDPDARASVDAGPSALLFRVASASVFGLVRSDGETLLVRRALSDDAFTVIGALPSGTYRQIAGPRDRVTLVDEARGRVIVADAASAPGALTYVELPGSRAAWDPAGRNLLHWNDLELYEYSAASNADHLITRLGTPIVDAGWAPGAPGDGVIAYADGRGFHLAEPDIGFDRRFLTLARFSRLERVAASPDGRTAWFVGAIGDKTGIWTMRIR